MSRDYVYDADYYYELIKKEKNKMAKEEKEVKDVKEQAPEGSYLALAQKAKAENRTASIMPVFVEFKQEGMTIIGKFKGRHQVGQDSENTKSYYQYTFDTDSGLVKFHMGNATDADAGSLMVEDGIYIITFLGQENIGGARRVNKFSVERIMITDDDIVGGNEDKVF